MKFRLVENDLDPNAEEVIDNMPEEDQEVIEDLTEILDIDTPIENPGLVSKALDRSLDIAIDAYEDGEIAGKAANVLFVGRAGTGKTSQIKQWAKARKVNLVMKDAKTFDKSDIGGGVAAMVDDEGKRTNKMTHLSNAEFDGLMKPGSVLFLDELNRADPEVMGSLLTLILDHKIPDNDSPGGMKTLKGFLFTVAAVNPSNESYEGTNTMDAAMIDRFTIQDMGDTDTLQYKKYELGKLQGYIDKAEARAKSKPTDRNIRKLTEAQGRYKLAKTILESPYFAWDTEEEEAYANEMQTHTLSPRGFSAVINRCNGTKEDLLEVWPTVVNPDKLDMVEQILTTYEDVDDKANDALKYKDGFADGEKPASNSNNEEELDDIFGAETEWDKLNGLLD